MPRINLNINKNINKENKKTNEDKEYKNEMILKLKKTKMIRTHLVIQHLTNQVFVTGNPF
jgi:hypothetical protein